MKDKNSQTPQGQENSETPLVDKDLDQNPTEGQEGETPPPQDDNQEQPLKTKSKPAKPTEDDKEEHVLKLAKDFYKKQFEGDAEFEGFLKDFDKLKGRTKNEILMEILRDRAEGSKGKVNDAEKSQQTLKEQEEKKIAFEKEKVDFEKKYENHGLLKNFKLKRQDKEFDAVFSAVENNIGHEKTFLFFQKYLNDFAKGINPNSTFPMNGNSQNQDNNMPKKSLKDGYFFRGNSF
jgi:hypothetical protein